jgi:iron complex outermembrane receptor protein
MPARSPVPPPGTPALIAALAAWGCSAALAQAPAGNPAPAAGNPAPPAGSPAPAAAEAEAPVARITVVGSGVEQRLFDTPFAVTTVGADALRAAGPQVNLSEALGRVPGLVVNLRHNYAQDLQISSRGFGARASFGVRGIRLVSDGIPAAGPDGQGQVSHFDIAGAERVEVLRGPFSALYGSSSGGVIALVGRAPRTRALTLDADLGSDGLRQGRISVDAPFDGGFSLRASGSHLSLDGFRPQSAAQRQLGNARLAWERGDDRLVVVANALNQPAQDPLGLTREQFNANPDQTAAVATQFNTRKNTRQEQAGLSWQRRWGTDGGLTRLAAALYAGQRSVTQWQSIAAATQANPRHPGGVIDFDREYQGLDLRSHWRWGDTTAVLGLAADTQREARRGFENVTGTGAAQQLGVTGRLRRDERNRAETRDVFAQAEQALGAAWALSAGVRSGRLDITSSDRYLSNGDDSGTLQFRYTLPVLALRWQPSTALSLYASAGRGYEAPTLNELAYRADGAAGFNTALRAQTSRQLELGAKWRPHRHWSLDAAVFEARTTDEIGVQTNAGGRSSFRNVGRTLRRGVELGLDWRGSGAWQAWRGQVSATVLQATYQDSFLTCSGVPCTTPTVPVPAGNRIAGTVPRHGYAELVWAGAALELGLEGRAQGRQPVNDANTDAASGHALLSARALWRQPLAGGQLELLLRVDNLADRRVAGSVIVNEGNQRFFEPAAGRQALASARWRLGF